MTLFFTKEGAFFSKILSKFNLYSRLKHEPNNLSHWNSKNGNLNLAETYPTTSKKYILTFKGGI